jgi:hypothetical protein
MNHRLLSFAAGVALLLCAAAGVTGECVGRAGGGVAAGASARSTHTGALVDMR